MAWRAEQLCEEALVSAGGPAAVALLPGEAEEAPALAGDDEQLAPQVPPRALAGFSWRQAPLVFSCCLLLGVATWKGNQRLGTLTEGLTRTQSPQHLQLISQAEEKQGNFSVHEGFNCVNGQGADSFGDENGAEGEIDGRSEFSLEDCMQECKNRMPTCEAVIMITDWSNSRCYLRTNVNLENCYQGTPYNLWVWEPPASTAPPASTEAPSETTAAAASAAVATTAQPEPASSTTAAPAHATTAAAAPAPAGGEGAAGADGGLWPVEELNHFCKNRDMDDGVSDRAECQAKCGDSCAGIAYSDREGLSQYCYICFDDYLIPSANDFHFYRKADKLAGIEASADKSRSEDSKGKKEETDSEAENDALVKENNKSKKEKHVREDKAHVIKSKLKADKLVASEDEKAKSVQADVPDQKSNGKANAEKPKPKEQDSGAEPRAKANVTQKAKPKAGNGTSASDGETAGNATGAASNATTAGDKDGASGVTQLTAGGRSRGAVGRGARKAKEDGRSPKSGRPRGAGAARHVAGKPRGPGAGADGKAEGRRAEHGKGKGE